MAISVVIPAFNEELSLARCVRAVLAQSGGAVVEVIVVDNGSRDDTHAVAVALADGDGRVRVLREEVPGVAAARRAGFDAASESVIAGPDLADHYRRRYRPCTHRRRSICHSLRPVTTLRQQLDVKPQGSKDFGHHLTKRKLSTY